jgi:hypothetical protein
VAHRAQIRELDDSGQIVGQSTKIDPKMGAYGPLKFENDAANANRLDGIIATLPVSRYFRDHGPDVWHRYRGDDVIGSEEAGGRINAGGVPVFGIYFFYRQIQVDTSASTLNGLNQSIYKRRRAAFDVAEFFL